jgi:hypothetical protein
VTAVVTGELPVPPVPPRPARPGALERDAVARQLLAIRRTGRASERLQRLLEQRGEEFERHEQEVIARLEQAGYLRHAPRGR